MEPVLINCGFFLFFFFPSILIVNMKEDWKLIFNLIIFRLGKWMREDSCLRVDSYYLSCRTDDISLKQLQPTLLQLASVSAEILSFNGETEQYLKTLRKWCWSLFCNEEARLSSHLTDWFLLSCVLMYLLWDRLSCTRPWRKSLEKVEKEWLFLGISHAKWQMKHKGSGLKSSWRKWLFAQQSTLNCDTTKYTDLWHIVDVTSYGFRKSLDKLKKKMALRSGERNGWHLRAVICVCVCVCLGEHSMEALQQKTECHSHFHWKSFLFGYPKKGCWAYMVHPLRGDFPSYLLWSRWSILSRTSHSHSVSLLCNHQKSGTWPGPPYRPPKSMCCRLTSRSDCIVIALFKWGCLHKKRAAWRTKIIIILKTFSHWFLYGALQEALRASPQDGEWNSIYAFWCVVAASYSTVM